jgi:hypothetical protein
MRRRFAYRVYGLSVSSYWPLPYPEETEATRTHLQLVTGSADFFVEVSQQCSAQLDATRWFQHAYTGDGSIYLRWPGFFEFLVSADGRRIAGRRIGTISQESFFSYLFGQVLSFALVNQGIEPIHSTAVVVDGHTIGFLGNCGYGKSSLAGSFLNAGHALLTDDLLIMKRERDAFVPQPGPARLKLLPETARSLLGNQITGVPMNTLTPKLIIPLARRQTSAKPAPMKALYVLPPPATSTTTANVVIRRLSERDAFIELTKAAFNSVVTEPDRLKRQFSLAAELASAVPIKSLSYPRSLALLPAVRDAVLSDLSGSADDA